MAPSSSSKVAAAASAHIAQFSIQYASIALVWYDYFLTFGSEVQYIWNSKPRWSTAAFVFTRYPLVGNVLYLFAISNHLTHCNTWYKIIGVMSVLGRASVIAIFTLRTTAIYDRNKFVLAWLTFLGITCVALDITHLPGLKCSGSVNIPIVPTLLSILVCVFELSASGMIAFRAIQVFSARGSAIDSELMQWILKQGLLYFCAVFAFQLTAVILNFIAANDDFKKLINALTLPMSCILTARFMLGLRKLSSEDNHEKSGEAVSTFAVAHRAASTTFAEFEDPQLSTFRAAHRSQADSQAEEGSQSASYTIRTDEGEEG